MVEPLDQNLDGGTGQLADWLPDGRERGGEQSGDAEVVDPRPHGTTDRLIDFFRNWRD